MTVKELMKFLKDQNPEMQVVLSSDGEGNNYGKLSKIEVGYYTADSQLPWQIEYQSEPIEGSHKCVALWPAG